MTHSVSQKIKVVVVSVLASLGLSLSGLAWANSTQLHAAVPVSLLSKADQKAKDGKKEDVNSDKKTDKNTDQKTDKKSDDKADKQAAKKDAEDAADQAPVNPKKLPKIPKLAPTPASSQAASVAADLGMNYLYEKTKITQETNNSLLKAYLNYLDPQHNIFLASDVAAFESEYPNLWGRMLQSDLNGPFAIYKVYRQRFHSAMDYIISLMQKKVKFDFTTKEQIAFDRSEDPRPKTIQERDKLWYELVKNDFLNLKLTGEKDAKIYNTLLRRYVSQRNLFLQNDSDQVAEGFINQAMMSIDPHSNYYSPSSAKSFKTELNNVLVGIGAVLQQKYDYVRIVSLVAGGPAQKGKQLKPGDLIIGVGQGAKGAIQDTVGRPLNQVIDLIRGKKGTVVRLKVIPASTGGMDAKPVIISITREVVHLSNEVAKLTIIEVGKDKTKVGIIRIPSFYQTYQDGKTRYSLPDDVANAIKTLKKEKITRMVIDLRGNGGGSLPDTASLLGLFMGPNQVVVQTRQRSGHVNQVLTPGNAQIKWTHPIIVLTDRQSASASEIFAGAIEDHQLGIVLGGKTWGKGSVQTIYDLDELVNSSYDLGSIKWTIAQFFRANGASTQAHGVTPNILVPDGYNDEKYGEEHEYKNALPYDIIPPAAEGYEVFFNIPQIMPQLQSLWDQQIYGSLPWALYVQDQKLTVDLSRQKYVVLNYEMRKQERADNEAARKQLREVRKELGLVGKDILVQEAAQLSVDLVKLAKSITGTGAPTTDVPAGKAQSLERNPAQLQVDYSNIIEH